MKAFLINPHAQEITEVDYSGDYRDIYELIDCHTFDCVAPYEDVDIWIDDEGLLKDPEDQAFFMFAEWPQPFAGRALILDHDDGKSIGTRLDVDQIRKAVTFMPQMDIEPQITFISL